MIGSPLVRNSKGKNSKNSPASSQRCDLVGGRISNPNVSQSNSIKLFPPRGMSKPLQSVCRSPRALQFSTRRRAPGESGRNFFSRRGRQILYFSRLILKASPSTLNRLYCCMTRFVACWPRLWCTKETVCTNAKIVVWEHACRGFCYRPYI